MMSHKLEMIINSAIRKANQLRHEYLTLEAILLSMLDDEQVVDVLTNCGAKVAEIRQDLDEFINDASNFSILSQEQVKELGEKQFVDDELRRMAAENGIYYQPEISLALHRVIQRAAMHVQSSGKRHIRGINLLVAMFHEKESYALYTIQKQGVERFDVVKTISHGVDSPVTAERHPLTEEDELSAARVEAPHNKQKSENASKDRSRLLFKVVTIPIFTIFSLMFKTT